jgi:AraC family transcriptional regulator
MKSPPPIINTPSEYANLYPRPPLLSSFQTQWQRIAMVHLHQDKHELPEVNIPWHGIAIFTTPGISERKIGDITKVDSIVPGDTMVVPANEWHSTRWQSEANIIVIGLENSLFTEAIDDAVQFTHSKLVPKFPSADPLVYQLGLSLKSVLERDPIGSRLYAETAAAMLTVHLLQHYSHRRLEFKDYLDGLPRSTLYRVIDYIQANLDRDLGLADLAKIANLSPHYFTRLFKQSTGFTPHQFVIRCRVKRAKTLLLKGKDSIADIAQQVGFANQAHLNVHLKRLMGITPTMILKQRTNL